MSDPTRRWPALDIILRERNQDDVEGALLAFLDDHAPTAITAPPGGEDGWLVVASHDVTPPAWLAGPDAAAHAPAAPPRAHAWRVFFASPEARDAAGAALAASREWSARVDLATADVEDEGWAERSQAALRAVQVGDLIIAPPWDANLGGDGDARLVIIEPSMGFGTGHHESTRLCLRALQAIDLHERLVLDLGTGSGVLAIAAAVLGAKAVIALDDDRDAVDAARDNVRLNGMEDRVTVERVDLATMPPYKADVVLANLTGALLRRHAASIVGHIARGGAIIISGFTEDERFAVSHACAELKLQIVRDDREDGWVGLTLHAG